MGQKSIISISRRQFVQTLAPAGLALVLLPSGTKAQGQFPSKNLKLIVPYAAGGGTDAIARLIAQAVGTVLGQTMIVENNGTAGGNLATQQAASADKDGYTVLMANQGPMVVNPHLFKSVKVDTLKAFDPVSMIADAPLVVVVPKDSRFGSLQELVTFSQKNPDKLTYGSAGNGSASHLAVLLLATAAKFKAVHVPYRGAGPAISDLVGGNFDFMITTMPSIIGLMEAGTVRALAVTSKVRVTAFPVIPTVAELGWPDYETSAWYGFVVPAGVPKPVIEHLRSATVEAINTPALKERLIKEGATPLGSSPEEFAALLGKEHARWGALIKETGLRHD
ncbi:MAG: tripartite tricarboxylate transporter substrate binding protein [Rhizobiales bacterium]|jgi:tripartite-type tricarboxylate transporter receptor subunit TctC|nr:tripartite tricarboxylate transporter substrate binding protein [Hyphomicrobiales bacterium]